MTMPPGQAENVWQKTLPLIRAERERRRRMRLSLASASVCALFATWIMIRENEDPAMPKTATLVPPVPQATLVVMRVGDDGVTRLEEISPGELGPIELAFGLTPMLVNDFEEW